MLIGYKRGQGSIILRVKLLNSSVSTGAGLTGLTEASSGMIIGTMADNEATTTRYRASSSEIETITTLGTFAAPTSGKCRFKEVDATNHKGVYEIQLADARFSVSSAKSLLISIAGATNLAETDVVIPLRDLDPYDSVRAGLTALPNAAAEAAGGLYTRGSGAGQITQPSNGLISVNTTQFGGTAGTFSSGRPEVNSTHWGGTAVASANVLIDGAITAAKIGADAITDAKVASDVTIASVTGAVGSVTGNVGGNVVGSVASVTGNVGGNVVGSVGSVTGSVTVGTNNDKTGYSLSSAAIQAIWDALTSALTTVGSIGKLLVDNINATISSRASQTSLDTLDDYVDTEVSAIKSKTDNLPASPAATSDIPTSGAIADAVWDEALSGHLAAGSTGNSLNAAGSAGDPWSTSLPGAYGAGTAGKIVGDNLNATVSSRASQTSVDTIDDFLDTEIAAILDDTNELQTDWANGGRLDLLLDAILADTGTDGVVISTATANAIADALLDRTAGVETNRTLRQALRIILASAAGKLSGAATATVTIRDTNDSKDRITATVDSDGNRSSVTLDAT